MTTMLLHTMIALYTENSKYHHGSCVTHLDTLYLCVHQLYAIVYYTRVKATMVPHLVEP